MRVIAGKARGIRLQAPKGQRVRPTLDRVRESLFNILGPRLPGARFLDLFAGTGANGIEALSRGAEHCAFVDDDVRSLRIIRANLETVRLAQAAEVFRYSLPSGLARVGAEPGYDIVFADPPYDFKKYDALLDGLSQHHLLQGGGIVVIEHDAQTALPDGCGPLRLDRQTRYGDTRLSFYA